MGVLFVVCGLSAPGARAGEVRLTGESRVGYSSNTFNRASDDPAGDIDSAQIIFGLNGLATDQLERGSYEASYRPTYFINTAKEAQNVWNHFADLSGTYYFTPRTSFSVSDSFAWIEKSRFESEDPDPDPNVDDTGKRRTTRNTAAVSMRHHFTPRWSGYVGSDYTIYRNDDEDRQGSDGYAGVAAMNYALRRQLQVGAGARLSYRTIDGSEAPDLIIPTAVFPEVQPNTRFCFGEDSPRSRTVTYVGFLSTSYQFDETMSFEVQAGPGRVESNEYQCSAVTRYVKEENGQTTWFAQGEFGKQWKRVQTSLRYSRQEGISGDGSASINDNVIGRLDWQVSRLWGAGLRASWSHRDSSFDSTDTVDSTFWTASARISRLFLKRLRGFVSASYRRQNEEGGTRDYDTWSAAVGVEYTLDPLIY
jgi:predicted porin